VAILVLRDHALISSFSGQPAPSRTMKQLSLHSAPKELQMAVAKSGEME